MATEKEILLAVASPEEWDFWIDCLAFRYWAPISTVTRTVLTDEMALRLQQMREALFPRTKYSRLIDMDFPNRAIARLIRAGIWED